MHIHSVRKQQRGVSLSGLLVICFIVAIVALLGMKVVPEYMTYGSIRQITRAIVQDPAMRSASLAEVKNAFAKRADVGYVKELTADDLDITKEDDKLVIAFAYTKKIPLFANVSLVIDFEDSTSKQ